MGTIPWFEKLYMKARQNGFSQSPPVGCLSCSLPYGLMAMLPLTPADTLSTVHEGLSLYHCPIPFAAAESVISSDNALVNESGK